MCWGGSGHRCRTRHAGYDGRGKSGLRRAGRRGNPGTRAAFSSPRTESATENKPPQHVLHGACEDRRPKGCWRGKGETAGEKPPPPTGAAGGGEKTAGGKANRQGGA